MATITPTVITQTLQIANEHGLLKEGVYEAWHEYYYNTVSEENPSLEDFRKELIRRRSEEDLDA
ncbi:hypothetical protein MZD04_gp348 [Pseudomonas phage Psa21]|uniref:Uncharacterized protein n=1 Tax=Pseudomonas phage Psa21 TaxID=2530023 RepID=A0A481W6J1_9CAUD|nr:hypothetical protein MZD04_gp348 [Pseudomonas phage Psa21]QBJ02874.1 hypothetical protein PSA21_348 [Pseudomonas phage Psa21]